jgi:hypothetical protein
MNIRMAIKKEEYELIGETLQVSSLKRDQCIDIKYEEGYPPAFPVILCEDKVSSVNKCFLWHGGIQGMLLFVNRFQGDRCAARRIRILPINTHV